MPTGKRVTANAKKVEKKAYGLAEAITLLQNTQAPKFDESFEVHIRLGIDPKQGDQQVRGTVTLPHGIGQTKRIAVFATGEQELAAKEAGADLVGGKELIDKISQTGKADFDVAIATPDMMRELPKVAKVLGPKGLMPSPKNETVTTNVAKAVQELKKGKIAFRNDDTANIHQSIGKRSFTATQIEENLNAFVDAVRRAKPASAKGIYITNVTLTTTMGPGVKVALS